MPSSLCLKVVFYKVELLTIGNNTWLLGKRFLVKVHCPPFQSFFLSSTSSKHTQTHKFALSHFPLYFRCPLHSKILIFPAFYLIYSFSFSLTMVQLPFLYVCLISTAGSFPLCAHCNNCDHLGSQSGGGGGNVIHSRRFPFLSFFHRFVFCHLHHTLFFIIFSLAVV